MKLHPFMSLLMRQIIEWNSWKKVYSFLDLLENPGHPFHTPLFSLQLRVIKKIQLLKQLKPVSRRLRKTNMLTGKWDLAEIQVVAQTKQRVLWVRTKRLDFQMILINIQFYKSKESLHTQRIHLKKSSLHQVNFHQALIKKEIQLKVVFEALN